MSTTLDIIKDIAKVEYRTILCPLIEHYSSIAQGSGRLETVPDTVNNEIRNAFDHLVGALLADDGNEIADTLDQTVWHLLIARCNILTESIHIVREDIEQMVLYAESRYGLVGPLIEARIEACAREHRQIRVSMRRNTHPLPQNEDESNQKKATDLSNLLNDLLRIRSDIEEHYEKKYSSLPHMRTIRKRLPWMLWRKRRVKAVTIGFVIGVFSSLFAALILKIVH